MVKLSIVVPIFNERHTLVPFLTRLVTCALPIPTEIILIDDGSTDGTTRLLRSIQPKLPTHFRCFFKQTNEGKGSAVAVGIHQATGEYILIQDADLEYDPGEIPRLVTAINARQSVVYGSRNMTKNGRSSWFYYWGGIALSKWANWLYGLDLTDISTGYKLFPRTSAPPTIKENDFAVCFELTAHFAKTGHPIIEVPITYHPRTREQGKKIRPWDGLRAIYVLFKYRFWK